MSADKAMSPEQERRARRQLADQQNREATTRYAKRARTRKRRFDAIANIARKGEWRKIDLPERIRTRLKRAGRERLYRDLEARDAPPQVRTGRARQGMGKVTKLEQGKLVLQGLLRGGNHVVSSYFLVRGEIKRRTVARVLSAGGNARGTGFLVGPGLLMTNHHVLSDPRWAKTSLAEFDFIETHTDEPMKPQVVPLQPDQLWITDAALDYTIVAVGGSAALGTEGDAQDHSTMAVLRRGWSPLIQESGKAIVGERVNIIQHPHGEPQQLALRDNEIVDTPGRYIQYAARTQRGSSGSPVWSDDWDLVALHHAGIGPTNAQGQIVMRDNRPWNGSTATEDQVDWIANEGIRASEIVKDLNLKRAEGHIDAASWDRLQDCFKKVPDEMKKFLQFMAMVDGIGVDRGANPSDPNPPVTPIVRGDPTWPVSESPTAVAPADRRGLEALMQSWVRGGF